MGTSFPLSPQLQALMLVGLAAAVGLLMHRLDRDEYRSIDLQAEMQFRLEG